MRFSRENSSDWLSLSILKYWTLILVGRALFGYFSGEDLQSLVLEDFLDFVLEGGPIALGVAVFEMLLRGVLEGRANGPDGEKFADPVAEGTKAVLAARAAQKEER